MQFWEVAFSLVAGILSGAFVGVLFFQVDKTWKKLFYFTGGQGSLGGLFFLAFYQLGLRPELKLPLFTIYLVAAFLTAIISLCLLVKHLNDQNTVYKITTLDILLNYDGVIKEYYDCKKKEINNKLDVSRIEEKELHLIEKDRLLIDKEIRLNELDDRLSNIVKQGLHIDLPMKFPFPVDGHFLKLIPVFVASLHDFQIKFKCFSDEFFSEIDERRKNFSDYTIFKTYLLAIGHYVCEHLFDSKNVRIHFRKLAGDRHEKIVVCFGSVPSDLPIKAFKSNQGMIYHAGKAKRSLIKSANLDLHVPGNNDHIYEDYITLVFDRFIIDESEIPIISMGISVKNHEAYRCLMYFLNFVKFEQIVQTHLLEFDRRIKINEELLAAA